MNQVYLSDFVDDQPHFWRVDFPPNDEVPGSGGVLPDAARLPGRAARRSERTGVAVSPRPPLGAGAVRVARSRSHAVARPAGIASPDARARRGRVAPTLPKVGPDSPLHRCCTGCCTGFSNACRETEDARR